MNLLWKDGNVEISRVDKDFPIGDRLFYAGTFVVRGKAGKDFAAAIEKVAKENRYKVTKSGRQTIAALLSARDASPKKLLNAA